MPTPRFQIAVIIINYNSSHFTIGCVESIIQQTSQQLRYQIVVVDNNSTKADYAQLAPLKEVRQVKIVRSNLNLGFSAGNMLGVQYTSAEYYYFLNNDCVLLNDGLKILYNFCESNQQVGICCGQMFDKEMVPQPTFEYFPTLSTKLIGTGLLRLFNPAKYPLRRRYDYQDPFEVDLVTGSSMFVKRSALFKVGGMDITYFLYCEEEDLAFRVNKVGYKVFFVPAARYIHFGGGSTKLNLAIDKEFYISLLYFYHKHYGKLKQTILKIFLFFKLARKTYKDTKYFSLALFVLFGAHFKNSLRHKQAIAE